MKYMMKYLARLHKKVRLMNNNNDLKSIIRDNEVFLNNTLINHMTGGGDCDGQLQEKDVVINAIAKKYHELMSYSINNMYELIQLKSQGTSTSDDEITRQVSAFIEKFASDDLDKLVKQLNELDDMTNEIEISTPE